MHHNLYSLQSRLQQNNHLTNDNIKNLINDQGEINSEISSSATPIGIAISIFSVIGTILIALSAFPQTLKTMRDKNTTQLSFLLFLLTAIASSTLAIYGIGLMSVSPNAKTFIVGKFTDPTNNQWKYVFNYQSYISGFLIPGILMFIGSSFLGITAFMVAFLKLSNVKKAKKLGLTEQEYYDLHLAPKVNLKKQK
ncbi:PQ-loop repeat-containing protein [Ureaplasma sp. ES3154-GEN]|uniref:PQ-loop repeat-containing protein n=1 Tax=Ureaplasma sp. ES3154-GEN TaxID=2984844 RepID=UPI0021E898B9|nr:PQ-loop repeat-containing protein [Ureaplasma sp. ES3154-GEN]MCV3743465.1 PQ-loop repeat-containing protein [Ureaplasma sp. ES3154-GEN]